MATTILTRPQGSSSGVPGTIITGINISPAAAIIVDSCSASSNVAVKWIYTLKDTVTGAVLSGEVLAISKNGTNAKHNRYAIVGDLLPHSVNVLVTIGGDLALEITNLSGNALTSNTIRLQIFA